MERPTVSHHIIIFFLKMDQGKWCCLCSLVILSGAFLFGGVYIRLSLKLYPLTCSSYESTVCCPLTQNEILPSIGNCTNTTTTSVCPSPTELWCVPTVSMHLATNRMGINGGIEWLSYLLMMLSIAVCVFSLKGCCCDSKNI